MIEEIHTERLRLIALSQQQLQTILTDPQLLERELGLSLSRDVVTTPVERAIGLKLEKMATTARELHPWYTYWLVVVKAPFGMGLVGFKGYPDDNGEVEIGYGIDPAYGRQGYTTEAVRALIAWAFEHPECRAIWADPAKDNVASQRVLAKVGMQVYRETDEAVYWKIEKAP